MFESCCQTTGITPKIRQALLDCMEKIEDIYPNTVLSCLVNCDTDEIVTDKKKFTPKKEEFITLISSLRRSVKTFSESVAKSDSAIIHIKGTARMFSLFSLGHQHVLAFYTAFDPVILESFDPFECDQSMANIIHEITRIIKSIK
ncbi:uncharacterized protein MONOS_17944 [Monocercomonoides exilis]|uniref:uncharacterized protein n=1 Tax=Monocercomonoides exilis TaxID=2049356 RepID=UPI0035598496|nr:hypothetical protein MONOS_17944 [Monocercomonoides exilis]